MQIIFNILKQQAIGVISLAFPIIAIYQLYPPLLLSSMGKLVCSLVIGVYIFYLHYKIAKNLEVSLKYIPSVEYKETFEKAIESCGLNPRTINIRYAYSNEAVALTMFNTVVVDPLLWFNIEQDPEAIGAKNIIDLHIIPTLTEIPKNRILKTKEIFSVRVQDFVFKHELGHVFYNYSYKKLFVVGLISAIATYAGIASAMVVLPILGGVASIFVGMFIGGFYDLLLSYSSNLFFKSYEEKKADIFAAKYSTSEEIEAAANFFEKHQEIMDLDSSLGLLSKLPQTILSGHFDGRARARYLRKLI